MPNINETETIARKLLPIIYILDTSGSMTGDRISSVNEAMHDTVDLLKEVSANNPTAELKIGVLQFASKAKWVTNGLVYIDDFYWNDLKAGGLTDLGAALKELDQKLSRKGFLDSPVGYKVPVLIFMSDGEPTDDYEKELEKIRSNNKWFSHAVKIAVAVGESANKEALQKIVDGNSEAVIQVNDNESLKQLIKVVSVTASMIGSKSRTGNSAVSEIIDTIKDETKDLSDVIVDDDDPDPVFPDMDTDGDWDVDTDWSADWD